MNMRDPGEKGENVKAVIFAKNNSFDIFDTRNDQSFVSMQNMTGSSMVLFSCFYVAHFGQKTNLKNLHVDIFEAFG